MTSRPLNTEALRKERPLASSLRYAGERHAGLHVPFEFPAAPQRRAEKCKHSIIRQCFFAVVGCALRTTVQSVISSLAHQTAHQSTTLEPTGLALQCLSWMNKQFFAENIKTCSAE